MARLPALYREQLEQSLVGDPAACSALSAIPHTRETQRCSLILMALASESLRSQDGPRIAVSARLLPPLP